VTIVLDIYPAGEHPIEGIHSTVLTEKIREAGYGNVVYMEDRENATDYIVELAGEGDVVLTLGAGNVWKAGEEILTKLRMKKVKHA
jgi:UDP-N-acetylmuramate--alanine ligase